MVSITVEEDSNVATIAETTQAIIGTTAATTIIGSMSSMPSSSGNSIWILVNQIQLILLLPMLNTYTEYKFRSYVKNFEFASMNFGFLRSSYSWPFLDSQIKKLDYEQAEMVFKDNGIESGSFLYNHYGFVKAIITMTLLNLIYVVLKFTIFKELSQRNVIKKCLKFISKFLHFTIYVRLFIEALLFMFISSMLEISQLDSFINNLASYIISCFSLLFICMLVSLIVIHFFKFRRNSIEGSKYFEELYEGTKNKPVPKLYTFIFIFRRAISALSLVILRSLNVWIRCISFTSIQLASAIFTIVVKPFDSTKDNIIEVLNEVIFLILCIIITICNNESLWFPSLSHVLISIMLANNVIIFSLIFAIVIVHFLIL